jgi:hypothetical protein
MHSFIKPILLVAIFGMCTLQAAASSNTEETSAHALIPLTTNPTSPYATSYTLQELTNITDIRTQISRLDNSCLQQVANICNDICDPRIFCGFFCCFNVCRATQYADENDSLNHGFLSSDLDKLVLPQLVYGSFGWSVSTLAFHGILKFKRKRSRDALARQLQNAVDKKNS